MQTDVTLIGIVSTVVLSLLGLNVWLVKTLITKISTALHDMRNAIQASAGTTASMGTAIDHARSENTRALGELTLEVRTLRSVLATQPPRKDAT